MNTCSPTLCISPKYTLRLIHPPSSLHRTSARCPSLAIKPSISVMCPCLLHRVRSPRAELRHLHFPSCIAACVACHQIPSSIAILPVECYHPHVDRHRVALYVTTIGHDSSRATTYEEDESIRETTMRGEDESQKEKGEVRLPLLDIHPPRASSSHVYCHAPHKSSSGKLPLHTSCVFLVLLGHRPPSSSSSCRPSPLMNPPSFIVILARPSYSSSPPSLLVASVPPLRHRRPSFLIVFVVPLCHPSLSLLVVPCTSHRRHPPLCVVTVLPAVLLIVLRTVSVPMPCTATIPFAPCCSVAAKLGPLIDTLNYGTTVFSVPYVVSKCTYIYSYVAMIYEEVVLYVSYSFLRDCRTSGDFR